MKDENNKLFSRLRSEINNYLSAKIEVSEGVFFSQYELIKRIMKFKNRNLSGTKITSDLRYDYFFDIITPRVDAEVKNLRFDTKDVHIYSDNPNKDFPVTFIINAKLKQWMLEHGEDIKLKTVIEEYVSNGNVGFKKVQGGYETIDAINTFITNQKAESIDDTDLIERHEMTASELKAMASWDAEKVDEVIEKCSNRTFSATVNTTSIQSVSKHYEIFEYTGEISEQEYNETKGLGEGDEHKYFLAKIIVAGMTKNNNGEKYILFCEQLKGKMCDWYLFAHRGRYEGRFWRIGVFETLFDHQIRANEIANDIAMGLEWASKVIFKSTDSRVLQNIRADLDNGDVIITQDLMQVDVRLHNLDQLIADWNRLMKDVDDLTGSSDVVRGQINHTIPFRTLALMNENSGRMFLFLRQKITLPYQQVFREWLLPTMVKDLKGEDIFTVTGDEDIANEFRKVIVNTWYLQNLVRIGYHDQATADEIKAEKLKELQDSDPVIINTQDVWKGVLPRLYVTITGENSTQVDEIQNILDIMPLEADVNRRNFLLDRIYALRNIPVPSRDLPKGPLVQPQDPNAGPGQPSQPNVKQLQQNQQQPGQSVQQPPVTQPVAQQPQLRR